jgi:dephospho-CoA kinase
MITGGNMSAWPGKYVIGLTGNIATGKSVVRRMLEHLGAYGIDADALSHRAIAQGAPGYKPVVATFGNWILAPDGQVDRAKLARVVFSDPEALARLESIVHPLVGQAVDLLVRRSKQKVIVIEAIKLIESDLRTMCDTLWVTYAPQEIQLARLLQKRNLSEANARQRIATQPPQELKTGAANVIIQNQGSFDDTWRQVVAAWQKVFPTEDAGPVAPAKAVRGKMVVQRARPLQAQEIANFITYSTAGQRKLNRDDIMAAFGEKAFLLLLQDNRLVGLIGWQVENLVARTDEIFLEPSLPFADAMHALMGEVERASRELQCEIALIFLKPELFRQGNVWQSLGYQRRSIQGLGVRAWQEAAVESMPPGSILLFKQLRKDRVLRPV